MVIKHTCHKLLSYGPRWGTDREAAKYLQQESIALYNI